MCAAPWYSPSRVGSESSDRKPQCAAHIGGTAGGVWAPAVYTFLAMEWGTPGWLMIAAIVVVATLGMGPTSRSAQRYLAAEPARATA